MKKLVGLIAILVLFVGLNSANAQTDPPWWDGGSLYNVDMCNCANWGYNWLQWDIDNLEEAFMMEAGEKGPITSLNKQMEKLAKWLGDHGDGIVSWDVRNQSKVDNILYAIMEIAYETYWWADAYGYSDIMSFSAYLFYDAQHLLNDEYWD